MEGSKYMKMIHAVKSEFYHSKFKQHKGGSKEVYKLVSRLTGSILENKLPDYDSNDVICEELANFFLKKLQGLESHYLVMSYMNVKHQMYLFQCQISSQWIKPLYVRQC